jgi:hypothetical protein
MQARHWIYVIDNAPASFGQSCASSHAGLYEEDAAMHIDKLIQATDRRKKKRFPIRREMRYKVLNEGTIVDSGTGQTLNVSSGGIAFSVDHELPPGAFIELSISWPVLLDDTCPMRMIAFGRVLRSSNRKSVCTLDKYEFRTQARTFQATSIVRNDSMLQRWAGEVAKENLKLRAATA